jgi:acetyl esterase/lipase
MGPLSRRTLLGAAGAGLLVGCGTTPAPTTGRLRFRYAHDHFDQYADLRLPARRTPLATVVLVHGGYWQYGFGLDQMLPVATTLHGLGYATWNVEYRRLGDGGGWPATFEDMAHAVDRLGTLDPDRTGVPAGVLTRRVVFLGHSAGGHLVAWAAGRNAHTPGGAPAVKPTGIISLSGLLDLTLGADQGLGGGIIDELLGGTPAQVPDHYRYGDPALLVPTPAPVWAVHADDDQVIPLSQASSYVAAQTTTGGKAAVVQVPGAHLDLIKPDQPAWRTTRALIAQAARA